MTTSSRVSDPAAEHAGGTQFGQGENSRRCHRHGEEHPEEAGECTPRGHRQGDHQRVQLDRPTLNPRLQQVALDELDDEHDHEHGDAPADATVGDGEHDGDEPGDRRPDERDVGAEERDHEDCRDVGNTEHEGPDGDQRGVDGCDRGLTDDVTREHRPDPPAHTVDDRITRVEAGDDPPPHRRAVLHEEERDEEAEHDGGDQPDDAREELNAAAEQDVDDGSDRVGCGLLHVLGRLRRDTGVVDSIGQRSPPDFDQRFDLRPLVDDDVDGQPDHRDEGDEERQHGESGGPRRWQAALDQPLGDRPEDAREQQAEDDREDHRAEGDDPGDEDRPGRNDDNTAPGDSSEAVEPQRWLPAAHRREPTAGPRSAEGPSTSIGSSRQPDDPVVVVGLT